MKLILRHLFIGIGFGSFMITAHLLMSQLFENYQVALIYGADSLTPREIFLTLIFYVIFILGAIGYEIEKWRFQLKITVHFVSVMTAITLLRFMTVGLSLDSLINLVTDLAVNFLIILVIWLYYFIKDRRDVKKINDKLKEGHY